MKWPVFRGLAFACLAIVLFASGCGQEAVPSIKLSVPTSTQPATSRPSGASATVQVTTPMPNLSPLPSLPVVTQSTSGASTAPAAPTVSMPSQSGTPQPSLPALPPLPPTLWATTLPVSVPPTSAAPEENIPAPAPVTGLSAQAVGASEIKLSWNPSDSRFLKCYSVYRSTTPDGPYDCIAWPENVSFRDTRVQQAVTYYYYVVAIDHTEKSSEESQVVSVTTITPVVLELFSADG